MEEVVVTFKSKNRMIAMYFTDDNGNLDMQMSVTPELKDGEEPDLTMLLAGAFMDALHTEQKDNEEPKIICS